MCHVRSLNSALYFSSGKVVMLGTFVAWMFFNSYVKASVLFTTLALFEVLRASIGLLMPWGIRFFSEAIVATKRIEVGSSFGIVLRELLSDLPSFYFPYRKSKSIFLLRQQNTRHYS